ncbi:MAG TPA: biliverdin-producing heme oxygenase [Alloacidobacterium sp.]|jgi:heme oxygenase|nr:biliverdin-producing heme oxygenase [Alloacidobacterium sp.]
MDIRVLRDATADDHRLVEAKFPLMASTLTIREYGALLQRLHALVATWEDFAAANLPPRYQYLALQRARAHLLASDLRTLGLDPYPCAAPTLPAFRGTPEILGGMYVMEGSRLGGQLIGRHLERHFGSDLRGACTFFKGFEQETTVRWREFIAVLENDIGEDDAARAVDGAHLMFRTFSEWMGPSEMDDGVRCTARKPHVTHE